MLLKTWRNRNLSWIVKITIINSLVTAQFLYQIASLLSLPCLFYQQLKMLVTDFPWQGRHQVKYNKIIQNYEDGGSKLVDLTVKESALKTKWPLYFDHRKDVGWLNYSLLPLKNHRLLTANIDYKHITLWQQKLNNTSFIYDVWRAWSTIFFESPTSREEIANQQLRGNYYITRAGLPIFDINLVNSGLDYVKDVFQAEEST